MTTAEEVLLSKSREQGLKQLSMILNKWMLEIGMFTTCLNCCNWDDKNEMCMKFKQRPPAKIIVVGCSEHTDIPF